MTTRDKFPALYSGSTPAWDIGRPQPELLVAFDELALTGSVLDLGCGTGENTLELARRGLEAWGLDATPAALAIAEKKRAARGLAATFVLGDALDLAPLSRTFDTVLDCGLYHVLEDEERRTYRRELDHVLRPGGRFLMLGLATNPGGPGPRGYSVDDLRAAFDNGYREVFVRSASFWATSERGHKPAWLSLFVREGSTPSKPAGGDSSPIRTPIS
jgi:SAM-dependent methyltransferase